MAKRLERIEERKKNWVKFGDAAVRPNPPPMINYVYMLPPTTDDRTEVVENYINKKEFSQEAYKPSTRANVATVNQRDPQWHKTTTCIKISNIPTHIEERDTKLYLSQYGIRRMKLIPNLGVAYVTLPSHDQAIETVKTLNRMPYCNMLLSVELIPPPSYE